MNSEMTLQIDALNDLYAADPSADPAVGAAAGDPCPNLLDKMQHDVAFNFNAGAQTDLLASVDPATPKITLQAFQIEFLGALSKPGIRAAGLSLPRGNGKSTLSAYAVTEALRPGGIFHAPGRDTILVSGALEQTRIVFNMARAMLEPTAQYRFKDSYARLEIAGPSGNLRAISGSGRAAMGLGAKESLIVFDEPASCRPHEGGLLWQALRGALGKPGSNLRLLAIGTRAPAAPGHFWPAFLDNPPSWASVYQLKADPEKWDQLDEIARVNPIMWDFPQSRATLLDELRDAKKDPAAEAYFRSYRLNQPETDSRVVLIQTRRWAAVTKRPLAERTGSPILGVDLSGTSWSAAVAIWPESMRCEAVAVSPGKPALIEQEKRDQAPPGLYSGLEKMGALAVQEGRETVDIREFCELVEDRFGAPRAVICDRFRAGELRDAAPHWPIRWRLAQHKAQASEDILATRKEATDDGRLSVDLPSATLLAASFAQCLVEIDRAGLTRLGKRGGQRSKDDAAAALILAAGEAARQNRQGSDEFIAIDPEW